MTKTAPQQALKMNMRTEHLIMIFTIQKLKMVSQLGHTLILLKR